MSGRGTVAQRVLDFNRHLADTDIELPDGYALVNPFDGPGSERAEAATRAFYQRFYYDDQPRQLMLGSSPARRGTALTGVPFANEQLLRAEAGVDIDGYATQRTSSVFLDEVIAQCGGHGRYYSHILMSFVCPLGVVRTKSDGREVNANYYDTKELLRRLRPFIVDTLERQVALGVDTARCYCIGSGENYRFLDALNAERKFFGEVIPLEHPRFITQYNPAKKADYLDKYLRALGMNDPLAAASSTL